MTVRLPRLPAPGQTILGSTFATSPGGKGANQAVAARRAGAEVVFVTAVGDDDLGRNALELYQREGIDVSRVKVVEGIASGVALIFVGDDGENMIGVASGANHRLTPDDIDRLPTSLFRAGDVLLTGLEIPVETATRALERAVESQMLTVLNPAPVPSLEESVATQLLGAATVITPNRVEAMALAGMASDGSRDPDWKLCADRLIGMGATAVVITLGSQGCLVARPRMASGRSPRHGSRPSTPSVPAMPSTVRWRLHWRKGERSHDAAAWANAAAALAVTQPGAQSALPFREAIDRLAVGVGVN